MLHNNPSKSKCLNGEEYVIVNKVNHLSSNSESPMNKHAFFSFDHTLSYHRLLLPTGL